MYILHRFLQVEWPSGDLACVLYVGNSVRIMVPQWKRRVHGHSTIVHRVRRTLNNCAGWCIDQRHDADVWLSTIKDMRDE